jgi:hypothetical protein
VVSQSLASGFSIQQVDTTARYSQLALEATNWITSFQVTPLNDSWGIPYQNENAWGLDPYFFENGTITAGVGNITGGAKQTVAYLIGGHDAGEGASAALDAYLQTHDPKYLRIFQVYYGYFQAAQIPGTRTITPAENLAEIGGRNVTIDNAGYWAEQASAYAGANGTYGSNNDKTILEAIYPAAEHGNPIAITLIDYYRWTHDPSTLSMLNRYGNWLLATQIHTGEYAGAFPVTQYYWAEGWKPRMYETSESAWVLAELYQLTGNTTYLNSAEAAGQYMLSKQFVGPEWENTRVYGALPYEWNGTHYIRSVSTNHAGYTILAWTQLYRITQDARYIDAVEKYADWLLSFQVTNSNTPWGDHTYANDTMAVGGFYYGYSTDKHEFGWRVAESLWSAGDAIPALLLLSQTTGNAKYEQSAVLAANWLTQMHYEDVSLVPLQALAITKYEFSGWWGLFPQYYQPSMDQVRQAGIVAFVSQGTANASSIRDRNPTWFERTFNIDFNLIDYEMASRGPTFMKMIWSWWPGLGFEPRYGGDIAIGAFAIANFLAAKDNLVEAQSMLNEIEQETENQTWEQPQNVTHAYDQAVALFTAAKGNFDSGWYSVANSQVEDAISSARTALSDLSIVNPLQKTNWTIIGLASILLITLVASNVYWYQKTTSSKHRRVRSNRKQATHSHRS